MHVNRFVRLIEDGNYGDSTKKGAIGIVTKGSNDVLLSVFMFRPPVEWIGYPVGDCTFGQRYIRTSSVEFVTVRLTAKERETLSFWAKGAGFELPFE